MARPWDPLRTRPSSTEGGERWAEAPGDLVYFILKRLVWLPLVLLGVTLITFYFSHLAVPNPCVVWEPKAHGAALQACMQANGLNKPVLVQFWNYVGNLVSGNWGASPQGSPVLPSIAAAFPETLELVLAALFLMIVIGIPLGVIAAQYSGRVPDHLVRVFYLTGWATPTYLGAVVAAIYFAPKLGLPSGGDFSVLTTPFPQVTHMSILDSLIAGSPAYTIDAISHLILPAAVLAFINLGIATRMTRALDAGGAPPRLRQVRPDEGAHRVLGIVQARAPQRAHHHDHGARRDGGGAPLRHGGRRGGLRLARDRLGTRTMPSRTTTSTGPSGS